MRLFYYVRLTLNYLLKKITQKINKSKLTEILLLIVYNYKI